MRAQQVAYFPLQKTRFLRVNYHHSGHWPLFGDPSRGLLTCRAGKLCELLLATPKKFQHRSMTNKKRGFSPSQKATGLALGQAAPAGALEPARPRAREPACSQCFFGNHWPTKRSSSRWSKVRLFIVNTFTNAKYDMSRSQGCQDVSESTLDLGRTRSGDDPNADVRVGSNLIVSKAHMGKPKVGRTQSCSLVCPSNPQVHSNLGCSFL